jgi:hypothetical protein
VIVPAGLGDDDRLGGVSVLDHDLAQQLRPVEVHRAGVGRRVGRKGPAIRVRRQGIEIGGGSRCVHGPQVFPIIYPPLAARRGQRGRQGPGKDLYVWIVRLMAGYTCRSISAYPAGSGGR